VPRIQLANAPLAMGHDFNGKIADAHDPVLDAAPKKSTPALAPPTDSAPG